MRVASVRLVFVSLALAASASCSVLVDFAEKGVPECDGDCADATVAVEDAPAAPLDELHLYEGAEDASVDSPRDAPADSVSDAPRDALDPCRQAADGTLCGFASCGACSYCAKGTCGASKPCPDGHNWDPKNSLARCCGGIAVMTNTNANCGVCGVKCKTAGSANQSCAKIGGRWLCGGCTADTDCWSNCCSTDPAPNHCAASDCKGNCPAGLCPAPAVCKAGTGSAPNYCAYE